MERRTSATARLLAALALIAAVVAVVAIVSGSLGEDGPSPSTQTQGRSDNAANNSGQQSKQNETRKVYVVKSGDTLSAIAVKTGVSVADLQELNPEVDALALVEGDTLKLR